MSDPTPKPRRFYKAVEVAPVEGGFSVRLDGRAAKTPGGKVLAAPTLMLATRLADEWEAQGEHIDLSAMPATRLAFTAIDRTPLAHDEVAAEVARYANSDLLSYPAEAPLALAERQAAQWGPWVRWADTALGVRLQISMGVAPINQAREDLARVHELAAGLDDFALTGLAFAGGLFGSAVLAFAALRGDIDAREAFELSRLDEAFQEEQWGVDAEAAARTERLRVEAAMLGDWFAALRV